MEKLLTCVAVDDEAPALRIIEQYVSRLPQLKLVQQFRNPLVATEWLANNEADILFMDIQMPQQSGITMLQLLIKPPLTIFTTAYSEFAADAFDLDAIDYLRKPFSYERFCRSIDKARDHMNMRATKDNSALPENNVNEEYITIKADGVVVKLYLKDILYIEGFQEYLKIFTADRRYVIYERMKNMEKILPASLFMRVQKSYIVAIKQVKSITGNMLKINGQEIPVSRDLKEEVMKKIF